MPDENGPRPASGCPPPEANGDKDLASPPALPNGDVEWLPETRPPKGPATAEPPSKRAVDAPKTLPEPPKGEVEGKAPPPPPPPKGEVVLGLASPNGDACTGAFADADDEEAPPQAPNGEGAIDGELAVANGDEDGGAKGLVPNVVAASPESEA